MKNKVNKKVIVIPLALMLFFAITIVFNFTSSQSALIESGKEVKTKSDLTYYLKVNYDGVDKYGIESSSETIADINSGIIYVEDIIPEGLTFNGFVTTEDGTIGAINETTNQACLGKVVDDTDGTETLTSYHGLYYDKTTRKVSFKIKNLQAGCTLTVGIKTITPAIDDPSTEEVEKRRDFYNFATSKEGNYYVNSNTVHAWMGTEEIPTYNVTYQYSGEVPTGVSELPSTTSYTAGASVAVASTPNAKGYKFSGWTSDDVEIINNSFVMPEQNITLTGSFTAEPSYDLIYEIEGDIPEDYEVPTVKSYYESDNITVDKLQQGDIINGYEFLGWKDKETGEIITDTLVMGSQDITLVGSFTIKTYTLDYEFYDSVLPPNSDDYLPEEAELVPGAEIELPTVTNPVGYEFIGWYTTEKVTMPAEDLTIYGEWQEAIEYFEPRIEIKIKDEDNYKHILGEKVRFDITVYNDEAYAIHDIYVQSSLTGIELDISNSSVSLSSPSIVLIKEIPASSSITYTATYTVIEDYEGKVENKVEIIGVLAEDNKALYPDKTYTASDYLLIKSSIKICNTLTNTTKEDQTIFKYSIAGNNYNNTIELKHNECQKVYLEEGEYTITQEKVEKYKITNISGGINKNGSTLKLDEYNAIEIKFTNERIVDNPYTSSGKTIVIITTIIISISLILIIIIASKFKKTKTELV